MKRGIFFILTIIIFSLPNLLLGQHPNIDKLVLPEGVRASNFKDYLVQLAWRNSPSNKIQEYERTIAEKEVQLAKKDWHDDVQFGFNINEVSFANVIAPSSDNIVLYPLYQFTTTLSLGTFTNNKRKREIAEVKVDIKDEEIVVKKLELRTKVLTKYANYLAAIELLKIRTSALEDANTNYTLAKERFMNRDLELEDLNRAADVFYNSQEKKLDAEGIIDISIIELEEVLGELWKNIEKQKARYDGNN